MKKTVFVTALGGGLAMALSACAPEGNEPVEAEVVEAEADAVEMPEGEGDMMVDEREPETGEDGGDDAGEGDPGDDLTAPETRQD